ncbi:MAG: type I restriction-modification system subunit M [Oscillospiraceae bacterium]|nr:type I restriction-modification system subunit M [Oscillospiraceae bacterium]
MNKQKLASTIWESANEMRSKIEANEYKDFILGFIFYKYLSESEVRFLRAEQMTDEDIEHLDESDEQFVDYVKDKIGYFIEYKNLFSTWIGKGDDFDVSDVRTGLSAFSRLIGATHKKVFDKIFTTLQTGLSKLGESASTQTKAISGLITLINQIPMDGKQDYDVLGFIYEYLISNFAANAGKKAGEFYTPHEVSVLMSEIVAEHLKDRTSIRIYDPTSGSGSLLINIGAAASKYIHGDNKITYYAQELKENTYNLTRMNLVMRGIAPNCIFVRNGDTLEQDWPFFEDNEPEKYQLTRVDAVVSNPPYSQKWDVKDKKFDPRFKQYGVAPKGKADYAFLLHDLYHLEEDGIMTIVLPHGVLFRGKEEESIRTNLVENNNIDAIIGLPANIFFGTSIPTIIMVLRRIRKNTDILIIDASKGFEKTSKNNVLRASDIKRIADTIKARAAIPGFSVLVSKEQVVANGYNLNIPRYIDNTDPVEPWDIHSIMFGGIPKKEVALLQEYWDAIPGLKETLFTEVSSDYVQFSCEDIAAHVNEHPAVARYHSQYAEAFSGFAELLKTDLIDHRHEIGVEAEEEKISQEIFRRMDGIPVIDPYNAYQVLDNAWVQIRIDLDILHTEGDTALTTVDPNMVTKKKNDKTIEVQEGWVGRILPFDLVQRQLLTDDLEALEEKQAELAEIDAVYEEIIDSLEDDEREGSITNEGNMSFSSKGVKEKVADILEDVESEEITALQKYLTLSRKADKQNYIRDCKIVDWSAITYSANGTYTKTAITNRIAELKRQFEFPEDSFEHKMLLVLDTIERETQLKREVKEMSSALHEKTKATIEQLTVHQALDLLYKKWVDPITKGINLLPSQLIMTLLLKLHHLSDKYKVTFSEVGGKIKKSETTLSSFVGDLTATSTFDLSGLNELRVLLGGDNE